MNNLNFNKRKFNYKLLIIFAVVIILVIASYLLFIKKSKDKSTTDISAIFDPDQPIVVKKGKKYGYIDIEGNILIEPKYDNASSFNGNYAIVAFNDTYQVIDRKGEMKIETSYLTDIKYVSDYKVWIIKNKLYDSDLKQLTEDDVTVRYEDNGYLSWNNSNQVGIMNTKGKITYTYNFKDGESYLGLTTSDTDDSLKNHYCRMDLDNKKYAIVNCDTGKVIYDYTDKYISGKGDNIYTIYADNSFSSTSSVIYIQNDKIVYQSSNPEVELYYSNSYIIIEDESKSYDNRYSYYDTKTDKILTTKPEDINKSSNVNEWETVTGFNIFNCSDGKGIMKNDKVHLTCQWSNIEYFDILLYQYLKSQGKNYIMAQKDNKSYIIDLKNAKTIIEFNTTNINDSDTSTFINYIDNDTKEKVVYNLLTGKTLTTNGKNYVYMYPNYIIIEEGNKKSYYNTNFKLIYEETNE